MYLLRQQKLDEANKPKNDFIKDHMRKDALKKTVNAGSSSAKKRMMNKQKRRRQVSCVH